MEFHWPFIHTICLTQIYAFKALEVSHILLAAREVDAVLIVAVTDAGGATVVLKLESTALQNSDRIYAVIDVISFGANSFNSSTSEPDSGPQVADTEAVRQVLSTGFQSQAGVKPAAIGYLEVLRQWNSTVRFARNQGSGSGLPDLLHLSSAAHSAVSRLMLVTPMLPQK